MAVDSVLDFWMGVEYAGCFDRRARGVLTEWLSSATTLEGDRLSARDRECGLV
jgi:hypothetical protein